MKSNIDELLSRVESDAGKLIVLYLRKVGTATVDQISSTLSLGKMKTYSVVASLEERDLITELEHASQQRYALKQIKM